ncbi:MAG: helix-turn-helix domain-containing protein [Solirubrobacteraceae bacterium]
MAVMLTGTEQALALAQGRIAASSGHARAVRLAAGLSLYDVARAIGTSAASVSRWESGVCLPRGELAVRYGGLVTALAQQIEPTHSDAPAGNQGVAASSGGALGDALPV